MQNLLHWNGYHDVNFLISFILFFLAWSRQILGCAKMTYILHFDFTIKVVTNMCVIYHSMVCRGVHQNGADVSSPAIFDQSCYMRPPRLVQNPFHRTMSCKGTHHRPQYVPDVNWPLDTVPLNPFSKLFISYNALHGNWTRFHCIEIGMHALSIQQYWSL